MGHHYAGWATNLSTDRSDNLSDKSNNLSDRSDNLSDKSDNLSDRSGNLFFTEVAYIGHAHSVSQTDSKHLTSHFCDVCISTL